MTVEPEQPTVVSKDTAWALAPFLITSCLPKKMVPLFLNSNGFPSWIQKTELREIISGLRLPGSSSEVLNMPLLI